MLWCRDVWGQLTISVDRLVSFTSKNAILSHRALAFALAGDFLLRSCACILSQDVNLQWPRSLLRKLSAWARTLERQMMMGHTNQFSNF